jgi:hypothetical protein
MNVKNGEDQNRCERKRDGRQGRGSGWCHQGSQRRVAAKTGGRRESVKDREDDAWKR